MSKIVITTEKGFTKIEMLESISTRELILAKNILDKTAWERLESNSKPRMRFKKKISRFFRRLFREIKKSLSAKPRENHVTVLKPLLLEPVIKK